MNGITKIEIQHDEAARKYYAVVDGQESVCEYGEVGEKTLNFWHTYVPPALRGRGIAEQLVHQALEDARDRGFKVVPSCWYVRLYIDRHPQLKDVLAGR
ncbi:MAG TPA: GNAT family N-acetyltransferase [Thermoanaerobaculia bacterium]|jgi:Predicted acetyltransferase|nr:GNAT family N-acetyltransferase [Thermoanaerobaculia bacterium]